MLGEVAQTVKPKFVGDRFTRPWLTAYVARPRMITIRATGRRNRTPPMSVVFRELLHRLLRIMASFSAAKTRLVSCDQRKRIQM